MRLSTGCDKLPHCLKCPLRCSHAACRKNHTNGIAPCGSRCGAFRVSGRQPHANSTLHQASLRSWKPVAAGSDVGWSRVLPSFSCASKVQEISHGNSPPSHRSSSLRIAGIRPPSDRTAESLKLSPVLSWPTGMRIVPVGPLRWRLSMIELMGVMVLVLGLGFAAFLEIFNPDL